MHYARDIALTRTAAAFGLIPLPVQQAFSSNSALGPDLRSHPIVDRATQKVSDVDREGNQLSLWVAPLEGSAEGECIALVGSRPGADELGKAFEESASCGTGSGATGTFDQGQGSRWKSPTTGKIYFRIAGTTGDAEAVQLRVPGKAPVALAVANGWYIGSIPLDEYQRATLVALDSTALSSKATQSGKASNSPTPPRDTGLRNPHWAGKLSAIKTDVRFLTPYWIWQQTFFAYSRNDPTD